MTSDGTSDGTSPAVEESADTSVDTTPAEVEAEESVNTSVYTADIQSEGCTPDDFDNSASPAVYDYESAYETSFDVMDRYEYTPYEYDVMYR